MTRHSNDLAEVLWEVEVGVQVLTGILDRVKSRTRNAAAADTLHERSLQRDSRCWIVIRDAFIAAFVRATTRLRRGSESIRDKSQMQVS